METAERNALVLQYQRLVHKIANRIWKHHPDCRRRVGSYDNLVSAGQLGLIHAARCYKAGHESNAGFMTYAYRSIQQNMLREIGSQGVIAVPENVRKVLYGGKGSTKYVHEAKRAARAHPLPYHFDLDHERGEELLSTENYWEDIKQELTHLRPEEKQLLVERFGLNGTEPHTLEEMGRPRNLSKERIRQKLDVLYKRLHKQLAGKFDA